MQISSRDVFYNVSTHSCHDLALRIAYSLPPRWRVEERERERERDKTNVPLEETVSRRAFNFAATNPSGTEIKIPFAAFA
jgi:hypothetical protein